MQPSGHLRIASQKLAGKLRGLTLVVAGSASEATILSPVVSQTGVLFVVPKPPPLQFQATEIRRHSIRGTGWWADAIQGQRRINTAILLPHTSGLASRSFERLGSDIPSRLTAASGEGTMVMHSNHHHSRRRQARMMLLQVASSFMIYKK